MVHGGKVLFVGTDDEDERTNLSGLDLFPDVLRHLSGLANLRGHPFGFYQRMGFSIVGVVPDANGFGRPDILMAKRWQLTRAVPGSQRHVPSPLFPALHAHSILLSCRAPIPICGC